MYSPREHKRTNSGTQPENTGEHNGSGEILYFKLALPSSVLVAFLFNRNSNIRLI